MPKSTNGDGIGVFDVFAAVGYPRERLVDPGEVTEGDVEHGDFRLIRLDSNGVEMFDIGEAVDSGREPPYDTGVEFENGRVQPIDFADETGPLNDSIPELETLRAARHSVVYMADGGPDPVEIESRREAVELLELWGSEGFLPKQTAEAMSKVFGGDGLGDRYRDDPDVYGGMITRAPTVARHLVSLSDRDVRSADSGLGGHKITRRQRFYRNFEVLEELVGIEE